jgi:hypothetical protein
MRITMVLGNRKINRKGLWKSPTLSLILGPAISAHILGSVGLLAINNHDWDLLINHSPYRYGDVQMSFARHNQGRN